MQITSGPEFSSDTGTATFTFTTDIPESMVQCSIDGASSPHPGTAVGEFANCTSPVTYTYLQTGTHVFRAQALGPNGLPDETKLPVEYAWEVLLPPDTNAPDTRILRGPPSLTANAAVDFEFTGTDDQTMDLDLEFECLLDGVLVGSCDSIPTTETVLGTPYTVEVEENAFGKHTLEIRAVDGFGNVDPTPAKRTWTYIDVTAPETSIELGPESEIEGTVAIFEFLGEAIDGTPVWDFECALDGADFLPCTTPHVIENLTVGPHYFEVRALGANGSRDSTPELYEWLIIPPVDTTGPITTIEVAPEAVSGPRRDLRLPGERARGELRVHPRQRVVDRLRLDPRDHGAGARPPRAPGARLRHLGERRPAVRHQWTSVGEPDTFITHGPGVIIPELDPETPITASTSATFEFGSDQANVTYLCSLDGSPRDAVRLPARRRKAHVPGRPARRGRPHLRGDGYLAVQVPGPHAGDGHGARDLRVARAGHHSAPRRSWRRRPTSRTRTRTISTRTSPR